MITRSGKDKNYEVEGIVTSVDIRRSVCKVICKDGRVMINVPWEHTYGGLGRSGFSYTPAPRERVKVRLDNRGDPCIVGSLPPLVFSRQDKTYIGAIQKFEDTYFYHRYNASMMSSRSEAGTSRPVDTVPGDSVISQGGGHLGVTNSGSIIAKASPLARIFITKIDDFIGVISRNYSQFSESAKKVQENIKGRVYQYHAWYYTNTSSRNDEPEYEEIIGDVSAGEFTKGEYTTEDLPIKDSRIVKRQVTSDGTLRYKQEITLEGRDVISSTDGSTNSSTKTQSNTTWSVLVDDGSSNGYQEILATRAIIQVTGSGGVVLQFNDDGTASLVGDTSLLVNFPEVNVTCDTANVDCSGDATVNVGGNLEETVAGDIQRTITGSVIETVGGDITRTVVGNYTETTSGSKLETTVGSHTITGNPAVIS